MEYITDELSTYVHHHVNEGDLLDQFSQDIMTEEKTSTVNKKFATAINNIWQKFNGKTWKMFQPNYRTTDIKDQKQGLLKSSIP